MENSNYENEARLRLNAVLTYFLQLCFVSSNSLNEYGLLLFMLLAFSPSFCWLVSILWGQRRCVDFWTGGNCYNFYSSPPFLFPPMSETSVSPCEASYKLHRWQHNSRAREKHTGQTHRDALLLTLSTKLQLPCKKC